MQINNLIKNTKNHQKYEYIHLSKEMFSNLQFETASETIVRYKSVYQHDVDWVQFAQWSWVNVIVCGVCEMLKI